MPDDLPLPNRSWRLLSWAARLLLWAVLGVWALVALTWGTLHAVIVPRIAEWRVPLEAVASSAVGVKVGIGQIEASSRGAIPSFELRDVRLYDAQGRAALHLPQVRVALSVASLWRLGLEQLVIEAPVLDVRRTRDGRIEIAGLDLSGPNQRDTSALANWLFSQSEIALRQGTLRWTDEQRALPTVEWRAVDLVLRNPGRRHQLRLDATPPLAWGDRFTVLGDFSRPLLAREPGRWADWVGTWHADLPRVDLAAWRPYLLDSGSAAALDSVKTGQGAVRLWADMAAGSLTGATLDTVLRDVRLEGAHTPAPWMLTRVQGRLEWARSGRTDTFTTADLSFATDDGFQWPAGRVQVAHSPAQDDLPADWALQAERLDLGLLQRLAERLPLDASWRNALQAIQPQGLLRQIDARWSGASRGQPPRWSAKGQAEALSLAAAPVPAVEPGRRAPRPARPGVRGAVLSFDFNQAGGQAQLGLDGGALELPGVFEEALLPFDRLQADLRWTQRGEDTEVQVSQLRFANPDLQGDARLTWRTSDPATSTSRSRFPGVIDLQGQLQRADAARVHRYLPLEMDAEARRYVRESVREGQASQVSFRLKGDLWDFPFERPQQGDFQVQAQFSGVDFQYVPAYLGPEGAPGWPALQRLQTRLDIDRTSLRLSAGSGTVAGASGLRATQAEGRLDNYMAANPVLRVQARVAGPAGETLGFVNRSPLRGITAEALAQARASGNAEVSFELQMPLSAEGAKDPQVKGQVVFNGNDLQITPDTPLLARTTGRLEFTERGFTVSNASARLFGGELRFDGGLRTQGGEPVLRFQGQGSASAEGLRQAREWAPVARLAQFATGAAAYQLQLGFRGGHAEWSLTTGLQGMALALPAPLGKDAASVLPLRLDSRLQPGGQRDALALDLGPPGAWVASARYERDLGPSAAVVRRGALALATRLSEPVDLPEPGAVQARVDLPEIDLDAWQRVWDAGSPTAVPSTASGAPAAGPDLAAYLPTRWAVSAGSVRLDGRRFQRLLVGGSRAGPVWRANVDADELNGYLEYREPVGPTAGRLYARLARLNLPASRADEVEQLLRQPPATVPALDIVVDEFQLAERRLGRLEVQATNRRNEGQNEWRLTQLNLSVPEARLQAVGNWAALGAPATAQAPGSPVPRRTALSLRLEVQDAGALLTRFGLPGTVRGGRGLIEGNLGWIGSPQAFHYPSLSGQLKVNIERGQFLKADPGAARLLGVLSLQSLPRRLVLDFRDVFSEGFAFDFFRGDVRIEQGVAQTNNLQMKGVNAAVLMEGRADIARETQDLQVVVVPDLNAGTASLITSIINPAVGLGSFLAQFLLRQPLQQAATQTFQITGGWADPQVTKIEPRPATATPSAPSTPSAAPPSSEKDKP